MENFNLQLRNIADQFHANKLEAKTARHQNFMEEQLLPRLTEAAKYGQYHTIVALPKEIDLVMVLDMLKAMGFHAVKTERYHYSVYIAW